MRTRRKPLTRKGAATPPRPCPCPVSARRGWRRRAQGEAAGIPRSPVRSPLPLRQGDRGRGHAVGTIGLAGALVLAALGCAGTARAQDWTASCASAQGQDKIVACTEALKSRPGDVELRRNLARGKLDIGDGIGGAGEYGAIAQERPDDALAWYEYAMALATDMRFADAVPVITHALELEPARVESNKIAVIVFEHTGHAADAYQADLRLAGQGDVIAMFDAGQALVEGRGVQADPPAGMTWLTRAAEAGHVAAMRALARIHGEGLYGLATDAAQAAQWSARAEQAAAKAGE